MSTLKPCPFCGAKNREGESPVIRIVKGLGAFDVRCLVCAATGPERSGPVDAELAWNAAPREEKK